jgi:hypothetical protein
MNQKIITGDCINCESSFGVQYYTELTSRDLPVYCPFCGEAIEDVTEEYIDEEETYVEEDDWDKW